MHWITYSEPSANRLAAQLQGFGQSTLCESVPHIDPLPPQEPFSQYKPDLALGHTRPEFVDHLLGDDVTLLDINAMHARKF